MLVFIFKFYKGHILRFLSGVLQAELLCPVEAYGCRVIPGRGGGLPDPV